MSSVPPMSAVPASRAVPPTSAVPASRSHQMRPRLRSLRARRSRAGFTLVEMMVALTIGALVVAAVFTIGGGSARQFAEQQRVGMTQRSVRLAMDRLRRDVSRAGYLHVPREDAPGVRTCATPALTRDLPAVEIFDADNAGNTALDSVNRTTNAVSADRLRMIGNYATSDEYYVRDLRGSTLTIQPGYIAFRRSFMTMDAGSAVVDIDHFTNTFTPGRMLRIRTPQGWHWFVSIVSSTIDVAGQNTITFTPALPDDTICRTGDTSTQARVSPISWIEYAIEGPAAASNLAPGTVAVTGPNTVLVRQELDMRDATGGTVMPGTRRVVLEYAVDFNLRAAVDTAFPATPVAMAIQDGAAAQATTTNTPWQVRSVIISLAARTPEQDVNFAWPTAWGAARPNTEPLNRFRVFTGRPGAARVRQLVTEVYTPNLVF